ncbi:hypothetical protein [Flagellimonas flava]|uniref:Uncharacterized protein n=1 Tax=Flagellimonas flava TaxID=570519 RepID=A0A1M5M3N7_9FLAO|nr:hypothetical protein [Allomuricauda flava]SHG71868.1 hypothetical protein SAMN04488116_2243 [Allomuricauda flava]
MERTYKYLPWFFVLILILAPIGFQKYLNRLALMEKQHFYVHFHAVLMTLWCGILIAQPILILQGKRKAHQWIGRCSYGLVPILLISMFMMLYHSLLVDERITLTDESMQQLFFPFTQIFIFGLFYLIAMKNARKPRIHMRYVIVSSVSLLGPTIGRIDFEAFGLPGLDWDLLVMEAFLLGFLLWDRLRLAEIKPYVQGLLSFALVHTLLSTGFQETVAWQTIGAQLSKFLVWVF